MSIGASVYFKYLDLVREDIGEESDALGIHFENITICDFGCGNGITTYGLALEAKKSRCIGVDFFDQKSGTTLSELKGYAQNLKTKCGEPQPPSRKYPGDLCTLIEQNRLPRFQKGNIVLGENLPRGIHLAYCKKVLVNILYKEYDDTPSGEQGLLEGLKNITQSLRPNGLICAVEYDQDFMLEPYPHRSPRISLSAPQPPHSEFERAA